MQEEKPRFRKGIAAYEAEPLNDDTVDKHNTVVDIPEAVDSSPYTLPLIKAVVFASMGAFLFGYHLSVVNGPLDAIAVDLGFASDVVVSSLLAGAAAGSLSSGALADALGRRTALGLDTVIMIVGALVSSTAITLNGMIAGRLITGIAIGISSTIVPLYISEVAPTSIRGALGSVNQLAICLGILGALCINVILPLNRWPLAFFLSIIPAVLLAIGMAICPESPRWLMSKGMKDKAQSVMLQLWNRTDEALESSRKPQEVSKSGDRSGLHIKVFIIACLLFVFQQFSGINAIVYFSTKVFKEAGMSNDTLASAAVGATNVAGTIFASTLIDKSGRKRLLMLSYLGMGISMAAMAAGFAVPALAAYGGAVALIGTLSYILSFGLGVGPVPGLLVPELAPADIRGKATSFALTTHWITNFAIGQMFLPAVRSFGVPVIYAFFSLVCFLAVMFIQKCIVETKGKSLEEIEKSMSG